MHARLCFLHAPCFFHACPVTATCTQIAGPGVHRAGAVQAPCRQTTPRCIHRGRSCCWPLPAAQLSEQPLRRYCSLGFVRDRDVDAFAGVDRPRLVDQPDCRTHVVPDVAFVLRLSHQECGMVRRYDPPLSPAVDVPSHVPHLSLVALLEPAPSDGGQGDDHSRVDSVDLRLQVRPARFDLRPVQMPRLVEAAVDGVSSTRRPPAAGRLPGRSGAAAARLTFRRKAFPKRPLPVRALRRSTSARRSAVRTRTPTGCGSRAACIGYTPRRPRRPRPASTVRLLRCSAGCPRFASAYHSLTAYTWTPGRRFRVSSLTASTSAATSCRGCRLIAPVQRKASSSRLPSSPLPTTTTPFGFGGVGYRPRSALSGLSGLPRSPVRGPFSFVRSCSPRRRTAASGLRRRTRLPFHRPLRGSPLRPRPARRR